MRYSKPMPHTVIFVGQRKMLISGHMLRIMLMGAAMIRELLSAAILVPACNGYFR